MSKNRSKKLLKTSLLFLTCLLAGGSLLYKAQINSARAESPDKPLESINLVDKNDMTLNENTTIVGNVLQFGPSIGAFVSYKSKKTYTSLKMEFDTCLDPNLNPDWQRVILRGDEISVANAGETKGYFVCLYKDNYHLYKQIKKGEYISLSNQYYSNESLGAERGNIYNGKYNHFNFECYNSNGSVVINMDINGHREFSYVDNGSNLEKGAPLLEAGHAGLYMNSTDASWIIRSEITDAGFKENLFLGNSDIYNVSSTANISKGQLSFKGGDYALVNDEYSIFETEFDFKASSKDNEGKIISIGSFSNRQAAKSYLTNDGILTDFYADSIKIKYNGEVVDTINVASSLNTDINVKFIAFYIANQITLALKVGGSWHTVDVKNVINHSGYFTLYGHGNVVVNAKEKVERNFRILFIGNSITNHGPNAELNYHIGAGSDSWAMATSAPEFDYVHRTVSAVRNLSGYENTEFLAINVANWEHDISLYDYANVYQAGAEFEADLIVGRLGENVTTAPSAIHMEYYYGRLLDFFNSTGKAKIILTTKYWGSENHLKDDSVDMGIINLARHRNYPLVRLNDLGSKYASINNASADKDYYYNLPGTAPGGLSWKDEFDGWTGGVKEHPGMVGHENIASRVSECVIRVIKGEDASISKLTEIDEEINVELNTSNITNGQSGAYDYKKVSNFKATPIKDASAYKFANKYILYKAFEIETDGTPYRFEMRLQEDTTAQLTYKCYTFGSDNKSLVEVKCVNTADSYRDGYLYIEGDVNKSLFITVEFDKNKIFSANVLQDPKYGSILNFVNKDNTNYVIDLAANNSRYVTIHKDTFSILVSSGRDIEIKLKDGTFIIERKAFEVMTLANKNLNFCIEKFTSDNDVKNATSVIDKYEGVYGLETNNNKQVTSIYEAQIAYNGRNGEPLYLSSGVKVLINKELTAEQANKLAIVTANLPAVGSEVTNIGYLAKNKASYKDGVISIELNDLSKDLILALSEHEEGIKIKGSYKTTYEVNEKLDLTGMNLVYVNLLGEETPVALNESMVSGFDSSKDGTNTITITYKDFKVTVDLTILAPKKSGGCGGSVIFPSIVISSLAIGLMTILVLLKKKEIA